MSLNDLDVVRGARSAVRSILESFTWATQGNARAMIRVEVTRNGLHAIAAALDLGGAVFRDEPASPMRQVTRLGFGRFDIEGVAYYLVPSLEGGADWRVINPLDVA